MIRRSTLEQAQRRRGKEGGTPSNPFNVGKKLNLFSSIKVAMEEAREEREAQKKALPPFNSPNYFFVSTQTACFYRQLSTSKFILDYRADSPPPALVAMGRRYHHLPAPNTSHYYTWAYHILVRVLIDLFSLPTNTFFAAPVLAQDLTVNLGINLGICIAVGICVVLWEAWPPLLAVPVVFIAVLIHFMIVSGNSVAAARHADAAKRGSTSSGGTARAEMEREEIDQIIARLAAMNTVGFHEDKDVKVVKDGKAVELKDREEVLREKKMKKIQITR